MRQVAAIILAAGKSTRMQSDLPKVLHPVCGRPMLAYVLEACRSVGSSRMAVVVGHQKELVINAFRDAADLDWIEQPQQLGTGHAVMISQPSFEDYQGDLLVVAGDMPLVTVGTLDRLLQTHRAADAAVSLATCNLQDPTGYGRVIRDPQGRLHGIVEHSDCNDQQLTIQEVNISYYCFDAQALFAVLATLTPNNSKGEYYITDAVKTLVAQGRPTAILPDVPAENALGINSQSDLAVAQGLMQRRMAQC